MTTLFEPYALRGAVLRNRIAVSPMCEYSSLDGFANDWHLVHLGSRAAGGAGLVLTEAAAVSAAGRITPDDLGLYRDEHGAKLAAIAAFVAAQGAVPGIQLAHAGRKASTSAPWKGGEPLTVEQGAWQTIAPSPLAFAPGSPVPRAMHEADIAQLVKDFTAAARRALLAGFRVIEVHAAHGYLLHEFLSPLCNERTDGYGGSFEGRTRLLCELTAAVRRVLPDDVPLLVRISATDWADGGWAIDDSVRLARKLAGLGVDLIDVSSGGAVPHQKIDVRPGYQVPFAERIRAEAGVATGAVGMITEPAQADDILRSGQADLVLLARQMLRDPYWPLHAALALDVDVPWPVQYARAKPVPARA